MKDKGNEEDIWEFEEIADRNLRKVYESGWVSYHDGSHTMLMITPNGWRLHDEGKWWKPRRKPLV